MNKEDLNVSAIDVLWPEGYFDLLTRFIPGSVLLTGLLLTKWPDRIGKAISLLVEEKTSAVFQILAIGGVIILAWSLGFVCASLPTRLIRKVAEKRWNNHLENFKLDLYSRDKDWRAADSDGKKNLEPVILADFWTKNSDMPSLEALSSSRGDGNLHEWLKEHMPHKSRFIVKKAAEERFPFALASSLAMLACLHVFFLLCRSLFGMSALWGTSGSKTINDVIPQCDWLLVGVSIAGVALLSGACFREVDAKIRRQFSMLAAELSKRSTPAPKSDPNDKQPAPLLVKVVDK
ncbi:MAG: hypothetical protein U0640_05360 [Phycisphaerales bacterium]